MNRKSVLIAAWVIVALATATVAGAAYGIAKETQMEVQDTLNSRLIQEVTATATVQTTAGAGATASVNGNDAVGQINIQTGKNPQAGSLVHVKFTTPYETQPFVYVNPEDAPPPPEWYVTVDTNGFDIWVGTAPKANTNYPFNYLVVARPWLMYLGTPTPAAN